jgi:formate dehydrogenase subunit gamma
MGNSAFSSIATFSKVVHDYCGPAFAISLVFLFIYYVKDNLYKLRDIQWFVKGGGMLGIHAHAGKFNGGEKTWFWLAILLGAVVVASGLVLDFPIFGLDRETMELSLVVHGIVAIVLFGISFGHIYLGTFGLEGALETMVSGYCDENWAKEHHDDWYEEVKDTAEPVPPDDSSRQGTTGQATPTGA